MYRIYIIKYNKFINNIYKFLKLLNLLIINFSFAIQLHYVKIYYYN